MTSDRTHMKVAQAAARLGVSDNLIRRWFDEGRLTGHRLPGSKQRRITVTSVEALRAEMYGEA